MTHSTQHESRCYTLLNILLASCALLLCRVGQRLTETQGCRKALGRRRHACCLALLVTITRRHGGNLLPTLTCVCDPGKLRYQRLGQTGVQRNASHGCVCGLAQEIRSDTWASCGTCRSAPRGTTYATPLYRQTYWRLHTTRSTVYTPAVHTHVRWVTALRAFGEHAHLSDASRPRF